VRLALSDSILVSTEQGLRQKPKDKSKGNQAFIAWVDRWNMLPTASEGALTSDPARMPSARESERRAGWTGAKVKVPRNRSWSNAKDKPLGKTIATQDTPL
jgi:hypothetical protein